MKRSREAAGEGSGGRAAVRVRGVSGLFLSEEVRVHRGRSITIGRSRACTLSLQSTRAYLEDGREQRRSPAFRKISRMHVRVSFLHPFLVEVEDLSSNGILVDGRKVDRVVLSDFRERCHEIVFGDGERLVLDWDDGDGGSSPGA